MSYSERRYVGLYFLSFVSHTFKKFRELSLTRKKTQDDEAQVNAQSNYNILQRNCMQVEIVTYYVINIYVLLIEVLLSRYPYVRGPVAYAASAIELIRH